MPIDSATFNDLVKIYQNEIDSLIDNMGKNVMLYFKETVSNVNEEFYDPIRGGADRRPSYKSTSSNPEPTVVYNTKVIKALTQLNPSDFETFGQVLKNPQGVLRLKTYLSDIPDLVRCEYVIPNIVVKDIVNAKYRLLREPIPQGLKEDRYALTYWERI